MVQRGTLLRSAVDVLRWANSPMAPREALIADKAAPATCKQFMDLTAAIHSALRKRDSVTVVGEDVPARWRLKEAVNRGDPLPSRVSLIDCC
jgi:hypothetical protein